MVVLWTSGTTVSLSLNIGRNPISFLGKTKRRVTYPEIYVGNDEKE